MIFFFSPLSYPFTPPPLPGSHLTLPTLLQPRSFLLCRRHRIWLLRLQYPPITRAFPPRFGRLRHWPCRDAYTTASCRRCNNVLSPDPTSSPSFLAITTASPLVTSPPRVAIILRRHDHNAPMAGL